MSLPGPSITVQSINVALVKLQCLGVVSCHGKLTLTARSMVKGKGKKNTIESAVTIGTVSFSISGKEKRPSGSSSTPLDALCSTQISGGSRPA